MDGLFVTVLGRIDKVVEGGGKVVEDRLGSDLCGEVLLALVESKHDTDDYGDTHPQEATQDKGLVVEECKLCREDKCTYRQHDRAQQHKGVMASV